jgi:predicted DNA-binding protein (UPF0251 family)
MTTLSRSQLARRTGLARLEVEDLARAVDARREEIKHRPAKRSSADTLEWVEAIAEKVEELAQTLAVSVGVTIEQAASIFEVSQPTVRKWVREGLLERVPDTRPAQLTPESVISVRDVLAYLHDQDLQAQPWFREGLAAFRAGKFAKA